ncbi:MAG: NAD(P)/FAD-dependent oxidoreductase [Georgenia sp.]
MSQTHVIVGGGLTAAKAAETLRAEGFDGRVVVLAQESERPYIRPPLSKGYLLGTEERAAGFVHPGDWYAEHDVELLLGRTVTDLDPTARTATLDDGATLAYTKLLLATGSAPRHLGGPGTPRLRGVHHLRTRADSDALRAALADGGRRVVIIGAGWIGLEVAAAARTYGNDVTVLGRENVALEGALGTELGAVFDMLHREHGVNLRMRAVVRDLVDTLGTVTAVALADGERVPADVVVVGIGAVPVTDLAERAGLAVDNGVVVDEHLRASVPDVFAAGDVASAFHPVLGHHLRIEHWSNALKQGPAAARSMLGATVAYDEVPYFYTDQYDLGMEYSGYGELAAGAEVVYRGKRVSREFIAFWLREGRVVAGMNVNVWDVNTDIEALIRSGAVVDPGRLADESVPLDAILAGVGGS